MKIRIRKEVKAALLFIVALLLFIWGLNYMKGKNILKKDLIIYAVYERIAGLSANNPVLINGYQVGLVRNISFIPNDPSGRLLVEMGITEDIKIPTDSRAIIQPGLISSNVINIRLGKSFVFAEPNDTLNADVAISIQEQVSLEMMPVKIKAENLMMSLDTVINVIRYIFNEETRDNLSRSFASIRRSIDYLKSTTYNIDTLVSSQRSRLALIIGNVASISQNIEDNNESITRIISNFSDVSDSLAKVDFNKTIANLDKTVSDFSAIVEEIKTGEGSLSKLINNDTLYQQLSLSAEEMKALVEDMKLNPHRYLHFSVFGKNPKKDQYQPADK
ncbi:MAG: MlaD family protein [Bacteroidales bacterium]|nr:MlaD family protein [Bacteroidales bacterium]